MNTSPACAPAIEATNSVTDATGRRLISRSTCPRYRLRVKRGAERLDARDHHAVHGLRAARAAQVGAIQLAHRHADRRRGLGLAVARRAARTRCRANPAGVRAARPASRAPGPAVRLEPRRAGCSSPGLSSATSRISSSLVETGRPSTAVIKSYARSPARSPGEPSVTSCTSAPCAECSGAATLQVGIDVLQRDADVATRHAPVTA